MDETMNIENGQILPMQKQDTVSFVEFVRFLLPKSWLILTGLIVGALIAGIFTQLFIPRRYEASSMIYVYTKTTSITSLADLQLGNQLTVDFTIVGTTHEVLNNVIDKLNLPMDHFTLKENVRITNPSNSNILKITVTYPDPSVAAQISNTLADELRMRIADVMNSDEPSVVERALVPIKPSSPSPVKIAALGGVFTAIVMIGILRVVFLMDDTIKTGDDIRKYLKLSVLAEIPIDDLRKNKG